MSLFGAIHSAASGLTVDRKWIDAVSDNITNVNTVRPSNQTAFQARYVIAQSTVLPGGEGGVIVAGTGLGDPVGRMVYQPDHPLADAQGYIRLPDIDLGSQMTQLIMAQRGYEANLAVVDRARDAYTAALQLGRSS